VHETHAVVASVGDGHLARRAHRDPEWLIELRRRRRAVIAAVARGAVAGIGADRPVGDAPIDGSHLADHVVAGVGDEDITRRIDRDALGRVELGVVGRTAVAGVAGDARARDHDELARGGELANLVVVGVGYVDIPLRIDRYAIWRGERGTRRRAVLAQSRSEPTAFEQQQLARRRPERGRYRGRARLRGR
jgi:hypothetical protein